MAENLQTLKKRIRTAQNIAQIAKAMEMIAASKIKKAQEAVVRNKPYSDKITTFVEHLIYNINHENFEHPYLNVRPGGKRLLIVLSPDKGLSGSLSANIFRHLLEFSREKTVLVTIGKKAERFAARAGFDLVASFAAGTRFPRYSVIYPIIELVNRYYMKGEVTEVEVLYSEFRSFMIQVPSVVRLLPLTAAKVSRVEEVPYLFEPGRPALLADLLPYYLEVKLYNAFINAFTSEQAARMMAMQNAKDNASEITTYLTRSYNKLRQERITNEILDLANGQMV